MSLTGKLTKKPLLILGITAVLSWLIYWLLFVHPIDLLKLYSVIHLDGKYIVHEQPGRQARLIFGFVVLTGLYVWGWLAARKAQGCLAWTIVLGGALACAITLLFLAPFDADDIYDYILHARITAIYHADTFSQSGANFPNDPFTPYAAWPNAPTAYGPLWEGLAAVAAKLAGNGIVANVIAFKLLIGLFWLASLGVAAGLLKQVAPQQALAGVFLLAFNPSLLYAAWGNGHNDMVMVFCVLLAVWALARRHYTAAILAVLAGALVKYIPLLLLPAAGLIALEDIRGMRPRLRFLILTGLASLALVWLAYSPFWVGLKTLSIGRREHLFTSSIPSILYHLLVPVLGDWTAANVVSIDAAGLTAMFALWRGFRARRDWLTQGWVSFAEASFDILAFYLLLTSLWFQQWYAVWLIGLSAILPYGYRQRFAIFFGLAVLSKQLVIGPYVYLPKIRYFQPAFEIIFTLGVLGLSWLYWLAARFAPGEAKASQPNTLQTVNQESGRLTPDT